MHFKKQVKKMYLRASAEKNREQERPPHYQAPFFAHPMRICLLACLFDFLDNGKGMSATQAKSLQT